MNECVFCSFEKSFFHFTSNFKYDYLSEIRSFFLQINQLLRKESEELGKIEAEYHQLDVNIRDTMTRKLQKEQHLKKYTSNFSL
jgi:hypothetical protein